jgi:uncharacterized protein (TIGR02996 family)
MHDEAGFLSAIRQTPADDTARLVFADWLDEQDDPTCRTKSAFIRLELRTAESPEQSLNRIRWTTRLQLLAARLDPAWLAVVSHPKLEACRLSFRFECPKQWEKLAPTSAPKVRHCESCQQHVHFCDSLQEARHHAARGHCVALTLALVRQPNDLNLPAPGQPMRLAPDMIERLGRVGRPRTSQPLEVVNEPEYVLPPSPPTPQWVPAPASEERERPNRRRKRTKGRGRNRNIQRDNWEDAE